MDRPVVLFRKKFAETSPRLVKVLRDRIRKDVQYTSFRHFHKFTVCLPALYLFQDDFKQQYIISVCDLDMKNDLKTAKVINWCDGVKNLYPLSTTGDGNCLLHAVSQALWGIEDNELFLRTLLYLTLSDGDASLSNGMSSSIQQRWKFVQDELKKQHPREFNYDVTSLDVTLEWSNVVQAASDILVPGKNPTGTPYPTLEAVHIFTLANLLKRPIIVLAEKTTRSVYGNSMQENSLYGLYLPLEIKHSDACKTPVILGYSFNHFAPLVTQANSPDGEGSSQSILPLVMADYTPLPVRFLLRDEEYIAGDLMKKYMHVKNIPVVSSDSINTIPGVVLHHQSIHDELDIVSVHRRECEQIFLNWGVPNLQTTVGGKMVVGACQTVPTSTTKVVIPSVPHGRLDPVQRTNPLISTPNGMDLPPCVTSGCTMFGSPETGNMCSTCFRKYTMEFNKRESQRNGWNVPSEPSAPPLSIHGQESYTDLSVMGVNCCNPNCGNRCSEHTYPYCHACKPQPQGSQPGQPMPEAGAATPLNTAVMETKCRNPKCNNFSAVAKPFCHECEDFFMQKTALITQLQSQPHISTTSNSNILSPGQDELSGTSATPARQRAEPVVPTQGAGAEGIDENSLFGEGDPIPPSKELGKLDIAPSALSVEEFEEVNSLSSNFVFSPGPSSQTHVINHFKTQKSTSTGTPSPQESGQRPSYPEASGHKFASLKTSGSSYAVITEEAQSQEEQANLHRGERQSPGSPEQLKQLCSTPGCSGVRIANNFGYCLDCWTRCARSVEVPAAVTTESTEESAAPKFNTSEINSMNPIVTTSKDKRDCASPLCSKKVYPPNKLCDDCIEVLRQGQTRSLEEQTSPRHERKTKSYSPSRPKCRKKNCDFHGSSKTDGYCSQCYKEVKRISAEANFKQTPTLSNLPMHDRIKAPPSTCINPLINQGAVGYTPVVAQAGGNYKVPSQSQLCLEPGCDKYGDENMYFRCTEHYLKAMSAFQPQPPPSNRYSSREMMNYNLAEKQPPTHTILGQLTPHPSPVQGPPNGGMMNNLSRPPTNNYVNPSPLPVASQNAKFHSAMSTVENNMKSHVLCKRTGCENIGSGLRRGYCSECYPYTLQRRGPKQDLPADDPRMNYGCC
ncbi:tumor necrosis factor alpha-induced protein 3-like [Ylistrum balloti]|uniref:tumor necrosis factor alpha-induced protein 3-like n=1 Tax=Ylistrum balloti TaxID=509963 RepID=UPI002905880D|nr:tumor necrosis factor alpha-induced protein 3-like [Ylistrum balloti]